MRAGLFSFAALAAAAQALSSVDTLPGTFEIQVVDVAQSTVTKRSTPLILTLNAGVLKDAEGRVGYIASNNQFQFDYAPQPNALSANGYSVYSNGSLAQAGNAVWDKCLSGGFFNLYDASIGGQCTQIYFQVINRSSQAVSQIPDGQVTGNPVTQIGDGQPQATTGNPITQIGDGQPQAPTGNPVTQIGDGQPQAPTGVPVTQISDGQPQAPTGTPVTQISDGQPQAPTGTPVTQISDGQPQSPATTSAPKVSPSGKPSASRVGTIGTVKSSGVAPSKTTVAPYKGAAPTAVRAEFFGLAAGLLAAALI